MKKLISLLLTITLISSLFVGCKSKVEAPASSEVTEKATSSEETKTEETVVETPKAEPVNLTFSHVQGEWMWPVFEELGKQYNEATGNTIEFIYVPAEGYEQWAQAQFLAGTEPDIMSGLGDKNKASNLFADGYIVDMKPFVDAVSPFTGNPWKDSFLDGLIDGMEDPNNGNTILGMPLALVTVNTYYNKDIFAEVGLPDKAPETYSELLNVVKTVQEKKPDAIPFALMNGMSWNLGWMTGSFMEDLWVNSGIIEKLDIITPNGKLENTELALGVKTGVIDPADPRFVDYFSYMKELSKYFNKGFNTMMWEYEKLFNDGQAAVQFNGSWYPNQHLLNEFPVNYGTGSMPYVDSAVSEDSRNQKISYSITVGGPDLLVTTKAQKEGRADAAVDFLRFLTDPATGAKSFVEKTMFLPVVKDVEVPAVMKGIVEAIGTVASVTNMDKVFKLTADQDAAYQEMFKVFLEDTTTPADFAQEFKKITIAAADQYIEENPDLKIADFVDQVAK
jgi:raffinose/stachyose/melibiose transport system substrate-binding protein